ncbi:vacuolar protein sorting-associated protein [Anaeramoeba flamelloides]|uniref:Vacuolar protein sorting-associated protein n=1 Tax=Anaeramoeba flamelloides TaxID=1746091 RepID=A0ABQ8ZAG4_9EUKA|nr:vacuolar protein sorting-associated protein [Anaeramoeba flamelloides]
MSHLIDAFNSQQTIYTSSSEEDEEEVVKDENEEKKKKKKNIPIFSLQPVDYEQPSNFVDVCASNNHLVIALKNNLIIWINLSDMKNLEDIVWTNKQEPYIKKIFLGPKARIMIICCLDGSTYYHIHRKGGKSTTIKIEKLRKKFISNIGWNPEIAPNEYGSALLGTNDGIIYEIKFKKKKETIREVYRFQSRLMITGIYFQRFLTKKNTWYLIVTTTNTLFHFIGGPTVSKMFEKYAEMSPQYLELPGSLDNAELHVQTRENIRTSFAFLNESGIYHGDLDPSQKNSKIGEKLICKEKLMYFPSTKSQVNDIHFYSNVGDEIIPAISMAATEYHFLLAWEDQILGISSLNQRIIFKEKFDIKTDGKILGFTQDLKTNSIWLFSERKIFTVNKYEEDRNIWKIYKDKNKFQTALYYCGENEKNREEVHRSHANFLFEQEQYENSASIFAKTNISFEQVSLQFFELGLFDPLKIYLSNKIDNISENKKMELTIISMWLCELYLSELNDLEGIDEKNFLKAKKRFEDFILDRKNELDKKTTFSLILSYDRVEQMIFYASIISDYEQVISHYIRECEYVDALEVLRKQHDLELIYRFSPILISFSPFETIQTWKMITTIDPVRLLPALMRYQTSKNPKGVKTNLAIEYLEYCISIKDNRETALHNYLLTLFVQNDQDSKLMTFLNPVTNIIYYNTKYALRVCMTNKKLEPSVFLYSKMGMFEQAVRLALTFDLSLAKIQADKPEDELTKKKLYTIIAQHIATTENNIKGAMKYLQQCENLDIQNILPLFPDFQTINGFKNDITKTLKSFQKKIKSLKNDMESDKTSSENLRNDLNTLRKRYVLISGNKKCDICGRHFINRSYYVFPCNHAFHPICLKKAMSKYFLTEKQIQRVQKLKISIKKNTKSLEQFLTVNNENNNQPKGNKIILGNRIALNRKEIEEIIAHDCILCGRLVSKIVEKDLINLSDEKLMGSWKL